MCLLKVLRKNLIDIMYLLICVYFFKSTLSLPSLLAELEYSINLNVNDAICLILGNESIMVSPQCGVRHL